MKYSNEDKEYFALIEKQKKVAQVHKRGCVCLPGLPRASWQGVQEIYMIVNTSQKCLLQAHWL